MGGWKMQLDGSAGLQPPAVILVRTQPGFEFEFLRQMKSLFFTSLRLLVFRLVAWCSHKLASCCQLAHRTRDRLDISMRAA